MFNQLRKQVNSSTKYPVVEKCTLEWFRFARNKNINISGLMIREKAKWFVEKQGINNFKASVGWLDKFRMRHDIIFKVICGESADVKEINCIEWTNNVMTGLLENIFNADETGFFYKCTPDKSMAFKSESCQSGKETKIELQ